MKISTVSAAGRILKGSGSSEEGSKVYFRVPERPVVVVAACVMCWETRSGMRNCDVQPAPRMRRVMVLGG